MLTPASQDRRLPLDGLAAYYYFIPRSTSKIRTIEVLRGTCTELLKVCLWMHVTARICSSVASFGLFALLFCWELINQLDKLTAA